MPALRALTVPSAVTVATASSDEVNVTFATLGVFFTVNFSSAPTVISAGAAVNLRPALITETLDVSVLETFLDPFLAVTLTRYITVRKPKNAIKWRFWGNKIVILCWKSNV